jgi:hypothetical protein
MKPSLNTQYAPFTPYRTSKDDSPFSACKPNTLPLEFDSSLIKDIPGGTGIFVDQYLILPGHALKSDAVKSACKEYKLLRNFYNDPNSALNNDLVIFDTGIMRNNPFLAQGVTPANGHTQQYLLIYQNETLKSYPINSGNWDSFNDPTAYGFSGGLFVTEDIFTKKCFITGIHLGEGRILSTEKCMALLAEAKNEGTQQTQAQLSTSELQWIGTYKEEVLDKDNIVKTLTENEKRLLKNDKKLSKLVEKGARDIFSDHTLFGFDNTSKKNTTMPGRHIAVDRDHAKQIFKANGNESILSIVVFKNGIIDFQKIEDFIMVINSVYADSENDDDFIENVKGFYSKKKPLPACFSELKTGIRNGLYDLKANKNKNKLTEFKVSCTEEFLFDKDNTTISVYKSSDRSERKAESKTIRKQKKQINCRLTNAGSNTSPSFVITHFVKEVKPK